MMIAIASNRKDSIRQLNAYEISVIAGGWGDDFPGASLLEDEDGNIFSQKNATSLCQIAASSAGAALGGRIVGLIPFGQPVLGNIGRMAGNFIGGNLGKKYCTPAINGVMNYYHHHHQHQHHHHHHHH